MSHRAVFLPIFSILVLLVAACSVRNPAYPVDGGRLSDGTTADAQVVPDGSRAPTEMGIMADLHLPDDLAPAPDVTPWTCQTNKDCDDKLFCTTDVCTPQKVCKITVIPGGCLIGGVCVKKGESAPGNTCSVCDPTGSLYAWTPRADGLACGTGGLSCRVDACRKGKCVSLMKKGFCVIGKTCVKDGTPNPNNVCEECRSVVSPAAYSFATGKPCNAGSGLTGGLCLAKKCKGFTSLIHEPKQSRLRGTRFTVAAYLPIDKKVWAGGTYWTGYGGMSASYGMLADLAGVLAKKHGAVQAVDKAVFDLHLRLAVGAEGRAWYHDGKKWVAATSLQKKLGGNERHAVWGRDDGHVQHYYLGGPTGGPWPGLAACDFTPGTTPGSIGQFKCKPQTGVLATDPVGYVFGTISSNGGQGPLWAMTRRFGGKDALEDIYYNPGHGAQWAMKPPTGCEDRGNTPCANTPSATYNFGGSGANDIWLVGSAGMIIHFDGKKWTALKNVVHRQTDLSFSAVFTDVKEKITILAAAGKGSQGIDISLYVYNHKTATWYGPSRVATNAGSGTFIYDMAGPSLSNLWMVGAHKELGWGERERGWILRLK